MIVGHEKNLEAKKVDHPQVKGAAMKVPISPEEGWDGYVMRIMELEEGGYTPRHSHPWPHINYMIEGEGILHIDGEDKEVSAGSYAYVPSDVIHQFQNRGKGKFRFMCIVPEEGHK